MLSKNQFINIHIDSISNDGNGVGRYEGMVVFVPCSAAGDLLKVKIVKTSKSHAYGIIDEIIEPSRSRVDPDCSVFGRCGGCAFRHINYSEELTAKQNFVVDCLKHIGKLNVPVCMTVGSPSVTEYRNKAQFPVIRKDESLEVGFFAARSHRIVPLDEDGCKLHSREMTNAARKCADLLCQAGLSVYDEITHSGLLRHIVIRENSDGLMMLALVLNGKGFPGESDFTTGMVRLFPQIVSILINRNCERTNVILGDHTRAVYGGEYIIDSISGIPSRLSLKSFFQINRGAAEFLYKIVRNYSAVDKNTTLLDLYCGVGSIGLSMAKTIKTLIGFDIVGEAIEDAKWSAKSIGADNARFEVCDAAAAVESLLDAGENIDVAIADPPRKGCDRATLDVLSEIAPKRIIMVSCNPATLARDLAHLAGRGYLIRKVTPVDMFPGTVHVECVALLEKL